MFAGFQTRVVMIDGVAIHARVGGQGPPLLLLHGYPQTHVCWYRVAPFLTDAFTLVAPDLRGYGDSGKPLRETGKPPGETGAGDGGKLPADVAHAAYSKRRMALDQKLLMQELGFERFFVAGHDRGGRVGHRLALDHPQVVKRLAVLDIAPTLQMYRATNMQFALAYFHWFFLVQPFDLPERLIGADPEFYLRRVFFGPRGQPSDRSPITAEAFAEYLRAFRDPAAIHGSCEDYRAAVTIDLAHDEAHGAPMLDCPLLVLWGAKGRLAECYDVMAMWRERATNVQGDSLPGGHYLPEEFPGEVAARLKQFFLAAS